MSEQGQNKGEISDLERLEMIHTDIVIKLVHGSLSNMGRKRNEEDEERIRKLIEIWRKYQEEDQGRLPYPVLAPTQEQSANFVAWHIFTS